MSVEGSTPGAGAWLIELQIIDPATGQAASFDPFRVTGQAVGFYIQDFAGNRFTPSLSFNEDQQYITLSITSGMAAGQAYLVGTGREQSLRGKQGEWLGTIWTQDDIT